MRPPMPAHRPPDPASDDGTLDPRAGSLAPAGAATRTRWALVVAWFRRDGERIGELAWVDPGRTWVLGRPGGSGADRLRLVRQRPGGDQPGGPLASPFVSREQLRVRVVPPDALEIENCGRIGLRVDGQPTSRARVGDGDVIELDGELVLLVSRRAAELPAAPAGPFGAPDEAGLVGEGPATWALRRRIGVVAALPGHVLVLGGSGSGKELVARAIHLRSSRRDGPWVACNAAAVPAAVAEAEWFGNRRDYPQHGMPARRGLAGEADTGTLLVDEIGEVPAAIQAKLLRLLDAGEVQRLGEPRPVRVDTRVVAATWRPVGALRPDLAARFPHRIEVPPLVARAEDVPLVARALLGALDGFVADGVPRIAPRLVTALLRHRFATDVRELRQILWAAAAEATGSWLDLGPEVAARLDLPPRPPPRPAVAPEDIGPDEIRSALAEAGGVKAEAARILGLNTRHQLRRLMQRYDIE